VPQSGGVVEKREKMPKLNPNFQILAAQKGDDYLFVKIKRLREKFQAENPGVKIYDMGIGDVSRPLPASVVAAGVRAFQEQGRAETFHGYAKNTAGEQFLREAIATRYRNVSADEIFIGSGAKEDLNTILSLFAPDNQIAMQEPAYPAYIDQNIIAGRHSPEFLPCNEENNFIPPLPERRAALIYLCFPNNPTGQMATRADLQKWCDYANANGAVILYDAVYSSYITDNELPRTIYECDGAKTCAVEFQSFSKMAGFTGTRCGWVVVPKELGELHKNYRRLRDTVYGGTSYPIQCAAAAALSPEGLAESAASRAYYRENALALRDCFRALGLRVYGCDNSPYLWLKTPDGVASWEFFDILLEQANVVGTPGAGFGASGEGFFRLTSFASREDTAAAIERIKRIHNFAR